METAAILLMTAFGGLALLSKAASSASASEEHPNSRVTIRIAGGEAGDPMYERERDQLLLWAPRFNFDVREEDRPPGARRPRPPSVSFQCGESAEEYAGPFSASSVAQIALYMGLVDRHGDKLGATDAQQSTAAQAIAACKAAVSLAVKEQSDYMAQMDMYNKQIAAYDAQKKALLALEYGTSTPAGILSQWAGTVPGYDKSSGKTGGSCWDGGHIFNNGGVYCRGRYKKKVGCGAGAAYSCSFKDLSPGNSYDSKIKEGCLKAFGKRYGAISAGDVEFRNKRGNADNCKGSGHSYAECFKSASRLDSERKQLAELDAKRTQALNARNALKPPARAITCAICAQGNSSACGAGASCSVSQVNDCSIKIQQASAAANDCAAQGGAYDMGKGGCVMTAAQCAAAGGRYDTATGTCVTSSTTCAQAGGKWSEATKTCVIDCQPKATWNDWGACSTRCGKGTQIRTRDVGVQAANGGAPCTGMSETRACEDTTGCAPAPDASATAPTTAPATGPATGPATAPATDPATAPATAQDATAPTPSSADPPIDPTYPDDDPPPAWYSKYSSDPNFKYYVGIGAAFGLIAIIIVVAGSMRRAPGAPGPPLMSRPPARLS